MLWVGAALDDGLHQSSGVGTGLLRPVDESGGTPFRILLVGGRHMFFEGGVLMGHITSDMAGHAFAFSEGLHGMGGKPDMEFFALQFIRHAVVVIVDFDVVVDVDGGDLPLGVFVSFLRQGQSVGLIEQDKELAARLFEFAKGSVIQTLEQFANGRIKIGQGVKRAVA